MAALRVESQPGSDGPPPPDGPPANGPLQNGASGDDARRQEHRQRMLQMFDTNHDGQLDDNEKAQMHEFMQQRRMEREQNGGSGPGGSGANSARPGFGENGGPGGANNPQRQEFRQRMLQKFDTNHDGQLDDNEKAQMHEFMQKRRQQREQGEGGGFGGSPPGGLRQGSGFPGGGASGGDGLPPVGPAKGPPGGNPDDN